MSNVYNLAPPTKGKVLLKTTLGDIDIELWAKEAPKATRNFVQLCMEGYYDGTIFHRVIKDFMVQGGDPTGTGKGGESIYGGPFKDEFHSRLRFTHRGIVASANENEADTNNSQFFITQEACPHLDKKHTIFGKVVGDSIYNVAHFNQLETGEDDRPLDLPKILSCEILWNPFDDIDPRTSPEEREAAAAEKRAQEAVAARLEKRKRKKNLGLLSFGEEAGDDEAQAAASKPVKLRSTFDIGNERDLDELPEEDLKAKDDPAESARRLKARLQDIGSTKQAQAISNGDTREQEGQESTFDEKMRAKIQHQKSRHAASRAAVSQGVDGAEASDQEEEDEKTEPKKKNRRDRQREALDAGAMLHAAVQPSKLFDKQDTSLMSDFEQRRLKAKERSKLAKQGGNGMAQLLKFKHQLSRGKAGVALNTATKSTKLKPQHKVTAEEGSEEGEQDQQLPAAWRIDRFLDNYEDEDFSSLAAHKLEFAKIKAKSDLMARNHDDDYMVQDPLADKNQKWDRKEGAERRRNRAWAADMEGPMD